MNLEKVKKALLESNTIKFGDFTLTSGEKSSYYIDLRALPSFPKQFDVVTEAYAELIPKQCTLVGIASAGVSFATLVGHKTKLPVAYIRKEALDGKSREYGTGKEIEGLIRDDMPPVLIDDVVSVGTSKLKAKQVMERNDYSVSDIYVLIDREMGATERLKEQGLNVHSVLKISELMEK